jgi:hypothetical protein
MIEKDYQWLLLYEHDEIPLPDCFMRFNEYIVSAEYPVVSGLYYTKSRPSEPLVFRGRGNSSYRKFKMGDKVWCDGVPTGLLLIHRSILQAMWDESPEYKLRDVTTRRVFETPNKLWYDPQTNQFNQHTGTSDLYWCDRVMKERFFEKAGWPEFQKKKYPFLVDTQIFARHQDVATGEMFP